MSNILTPSAIWDNIVIDENFSVEEIGEYKDGNHVFSRFYLCSKIKGEAVKIYCSLARNVRRKKLPALFIVQDFMDGADEGVLRHFVKKGYAVFTFDFAGKSHLNVNRTIYPDGLDYANYINACDKLQKIEKDATTTCWNVWARVTLTAFEYLKTLDFVGDIGALGIGEACTTLWQLVGMKNQFTCATFVGNAGWTGYEGVYKYGDQKDPQWTDENMAYFAGIDAQSYAHFIHCPTLVLVPTNSNKFDCDRAGDTILRIDQKVYTAIDYGVGLRDAVGLEALTNMELFFSKYLLKNKVFLPEDMVVKSEIKDGELIVNVTPQLENLEHLYLYTSEETIIPALRCWNVFDDAIKEGDEYVFKNQPCSDAGVVMFFVRAVYKNGFTTASSIFSKKLTSPKGGQQSNIIYSSRKIGAASVFTPARENDTHPKGLSLKSERIINVEKGPHEIEGVGCFRGIVTFNVNEKKYAPKEDAMLMLDVYTPEDSEITIKLISDYLGEKVEYVAKIQLHGGEIWRNIRLERNNFKTEIGRPLRDYSSIQAIEIDAVGYYLVNNLLWV